jgi:5'-3' exonuclease
MSGKMIELDSIKNNSSVLFNWFNHCMFLTTCILCGCDYLNQLPGIGLKKAK